MYDDFINFLKNADTNIKHEVVDNTVKINVNEEIDTDTLLDFLPKLFEYENNLNFENINVLLYLNDLDIEKLAEVFKLAMHTETLTDSLLILNLLNLIKIYNSLDEEFFADPEIYVNSLEDFIDLKVELDSELKAFARQISIYFFSLFKSYNKFVYSALDTHITLPNLYKVLFESCDFLTLSGIFSTSEPFSTEECVYLDNAFEILINLQIKGQLTVSLMGKFLENK